MNARFLGSTAMKTHHLLKRSVTPNLKDPLSEAEEPDQPFRLASPIIPIVTQSREGGVRARHALCPMLSYDRKR